MSKDTWKLGIIQDNWRHALGVKPAEVPTTLMRERTGLFLAKSQWPGVSLRLCVTDIGSEISNWVFILPKLSFATASPLCKLRRAAAAEVPSVPISATPCRDSERGGY